MLTVLCYLRYGVFFFKQKTAYELRISDWSSDVCSSDLELATLGQTSLLFSFFTIATLKVLAASTLTFTHDKENAHGNEASHELLDRLDTTEDVALALRLEQIGRAHV